MKKRSVFLLLAALCAVAALGFSWWTGQRSILPLDGNKIYYIEFAICPQDFRIYTITDDTRVREIADAINALDMAEMPKGDPHYPDPMSDQYYSLRLTQKERSFSIELDESRIHIMGKKNEVFSADCSALCALLEQTYYDRSSGTIE